MSLSIRGKNRLRNRELDDRSGSRDRYVLGDQMNLNGIQNSILRHSYDQMILQAYVVLLLHTLWTLMVWNLESQMILVKSFCLRKKACLTSSFLLDGLIDPGRSVAYLTTRVAGFCHHLILERGHQNFLVRGLRGPLLCDEAYELNLPLDLLVPSWNRGLVCGRSFREGQLHPCGVIFLALQMIL
jgi:hypothetical protein